MARPDGRLLPVTKGWGRDGEGARDGQRRAYGGASAAGEQKAASIGTFGPSSRTFCRVRGVLLVWLASASPGRRSSMTSLMSDARGRGAWLLSHPLASIVMLEVLFV